MKTFVIGLLAAASLAAALPAVAETIVVKQGPAGATVVRKIGPNKTVIVRREDGKTVKIVKIRHHHRHLVRAPQARS
jgi:plasmid stabilization system protein ParE